MKIKNSIFYFNAGAVNSDTASNHSILNGGVRARMRSQGSENAAPSMSAQPLTHRNSSNNFQDCNNTGPPEADPSNSRAVAVYTPFFPNGTANNQNNGTTNNVSAEASCSPMIRPSAQQCSSTVPNQADALAQEEPLPAGWEMRYDVYGRR